MVQRVLLALFLSFVSTSILSLWWGRTGLLEYRRLQDRFQRLQLTADRLSQEQRRLEAEFEAFLTSQERIALSARRLGYSDRESLLLLEAGKVPSLPSPTVQDPSPPHQEDPPMDPDFPPLAGGLMFLGSLAFLEASHRLQGWRRRREIREIRGDARTA